MFSSSEPKYESTINGALTAGGTSIVVTSATNFPTVGTGATGLETWVRIGQGTGNEETVRVTARSSLTLTCDALANNHSNGEAIIAGDLNASSLAQVKMDALAMGPPIAISATGGTAVIGREHRLTAASADYDVVVPDGTKDSQIILFSVTTASTFFPRLTGKLLFSSAKSRIMWAGESVLLKWDNVAGYWYPRQYVIVPMRATIYLGATLTSFANSAVTLVTVDTSALDNTGRMVEIGSNRIRILRAGEFTGSMQVVYAGGTALAPIVQGRLHKGASSILTSFNSRMTAGTYAGCPGSKPSFDAVKDDLMTLHGYQDGGGASTSIQIASAAEDQVFMSIAERATFVVA